MLYVLEGEKVAAYMVENSVEQNADTVCVQSVAQLFEALVVAQTRVDLFVVYRVVAVLGAFKNRVEHYRVHAHLLEVGDKAVQLIQPVVKLKVIYPRRSAEAQRVNVVDHGVVYPMHKVPPSAV